MTNRVVIVTGASSGIGAATVKAFYNNGWNVALAARNQGAMKDVTATFDKNRFTNIATDVKKKESCRNLIEQTVSRFGKLDCLINNAGISMRALFNETDVEVLEELMQVNFWGMVHCTKYALPYLLKTKGSVAGISSIAGYRGLPGRTGYSASKFAMNGFLEALRTENLKTGLHVLTVCPGFTTSNIRKVALTGDGSRQGDSPRDEQKMMSAEDVAHHIYKAVMNKKRTAILTRQGKLTVLLNKFFPGWMDKKVFEHFAKEADSPIN